MPVAAAAILDGMPDPRDLHRLDAGGETVIFAGSRQLFRFGEDDTAMRHVAAAVLRQLGFGGRDVAAVLGLSASYVATLHQRAWRAAGVRDAEIARRLGVHRSTVLLRLGRAHAQDPLPEAEAQEPEAEAEAAEAEAAEEPQDRPGPAGPVPPVPPVPQEPAGAGQPPAEPVTVRS